MVSRARWRPDEDAVVLSVACNTQAAKTLGRPVKAVERRRARLHAYGGEAGTSGWARAILAGVEAAGGPDALGALTGVSGETVHRWMTGQSPQLPMALSVAARAGCDFADLVAGRWNPTHTPRRVTYTRTRWAEEVAARVEGPTANARARQLAAWTGRSSGACLSWVNGVNEPRLDSVIHVCAALGIQITDLALTPAEGA